MKANRNILLRNDNQAQVGIGTLIIFIAMVLVAAVAAAVLIQTSGTLQQKAQSTGEEAIQEVSSNMQLKAVEGVRGNASSTLSDYIDLLELQTTVSAGGEAMDLNQLVITISDGTTTNTLTYNDSGNTNELAGAFNYSTESFTAVAIRDDDSSFTEANPVMNKGDLIRLYIPTLSDSTGTYVTDVNSFNVSATAAVDSNLDLDPRTDVKITLIPETGTPVNLEFTTPPSYGVDKRIALYP